MISSVITSIVKTGFLVGGIMAFTSFLLGYVIYILLSTFKHISK